MATSSLLMVISGRARAGWFESSLIVDAGRLSIAAWIAFPVMHLRSPVRRQHAASCSTALRGSDRDELHVPRYLRRPPSTCCRCCTRLPQGERPLRWPRQWNLVPQIAAFPLAWRLVQRVDGRVSMPLGLLAWPRACCSRDSRPAAAQLGLALIGAGQMLFLVPGVMIGAGSIKPEDGPTAAIAFNMSTVGGTTLGVGLLSRISSMRRTSSSCLQWIWPSSW